MEVRLDALEGQSPPQDTFVAIRIGEVQKQSRFSSSRTYRFPEQSEGKGNIGRIEVFKRLGFVNVPLDTSSTELQEVQVPCDFPGMERLCMKLGVQGPGKEKVAVASPDKEKRARAKERVDAAQRYLQDHKIEEVLADVMREVIQAKPENPHAFISGRIPQIADAKVGLPKKQGAPLSSPSAVDQLRNLAIGRLEEASRTGELGKILQEARKVGGKGLNAEVSKVEELKRRARNVLLGAGKDKLQAVLDGSTVNEAKKAPVEDVTGESTAKASPAELTMKPLMLEAGTAPVEALKHAPPPSLGAKEAFTAPPELLAKQVRPQEEAPAEVTAKQAPALAEQEEEDCLLATRSFQVLPSTGTWYRKRGASRNSTPLAPPKALTSADTAEVPSGLEALKERPAEAPPQLTVTAPKAEPFAFKASVGSWLVRRPTSAQVWALPEEPQQTPRLAPSETKEPEQTPRLAPSESKVPSLAESRPFQLLPSAGTWHQLRPAPAFPSTPREEVPASTAAPSQAAKEVPASTAAPSQAAKEVTPAPFAFKASVGSWLVRRPVQAQVWLLPEEEVASPIGEWEVQEFDINRLRLAAQGPLEQACLSGELRKSLPSPIECKEVPAAATPPPAAKQPPFRFQPSVGTWLASKALALSATPAVPQERASAKAVKPFGLRPSVGTWLSLSQLEDVQPVPATKEAVLPAPPAAAVPASAAAAVPYASRPSVGTWLGAKGKATKQALSHSPVPSSAPEVQPPAQPAAKDGLASDPVPESQFRPVMPHMPSVGSWLARPGAGPRRRRPGSRAGPTSVAASGLVAPDASSAPAEAPTPAAKSRPFSLKASVGTWLAARPAASEEEESIAEVLQEEAQAPPMLLTRKHSDLLRADPEELIDAFQSELNRKDAVITKLRALLALRGEVE